MALQMGIKCLEFEAELSLEGYKMYQKRVLNLYGPLIWLITRMALMVWVVGVGLG